MATTWEAYVFQRHVDAILDHHPELARHGSPPAIPPSSNANAASGPPPPYTSRKRFLRDGVEDAPQEQDWECPICLESFFEPTMEKFNEKIPDRILNTEKEDTGGGNVDAVTTESEDRSPRGIAGSNTRRVYDGLVRGVELIPTSRDFVQMLNAIAAEEARRESAVERASRARDRLVEGDVSTGLPTPMEPITLETWEDSAHSSRWERRNATAGFSHTALNPSEHRTHKSTVRNAKHLETEPDRPVMIKQCKHIFGAACLKTWVKDRDTCPMCRRVLFTRRRAPPAVHFTDSTRLGQMPEHWQPPRQDHPTVEHHQQQEYRRPLDYDIPLRQSVQPPQEGHANPRWAHYQPPPERLLQGQVSELQRWHYASLPRWHHAPPVRRRGAIVPVWQGQVDWLPLVVSTPWVEDVYEPV